MPFDFTKRNPEVTIKDRHCGYGKSRDMIASLSPDRSYLIVVPLQSEVKRFVQEAPITLVEPVSTRDEDPSKRATATHDRKRDHLRDLLLDGHSIVTTHALFTDIAYLAQDGLLLRYDVLVDEVLNVAHCVTQEVMTAGAKAQGVSSQSWKGLYLDEGFASVDPETGMVSPTDKWEMKQDLPELSNNLFHMAKAESLFAVGENVLVWELPPILLKAVRSLTVYTFLAEGSLMAGFMRRNGIAFTHDRDPASERRFREEAKRLIEVRDMPKINRMKFSFSGQQRMSAADCKIIAKQLRNTRESLMRGVPKENIMITSSKDMWITSSGKPGPFADNSRLFEDTNWVPNTTRGTNDYSHCSHLIYLWDQHLNPRIAEFLDVETQRHRDLYAISELIQWVYRSRVRKGDPITLYLPSRRMRKLLHRWMNGEL